MPLGCVLLGCCVGGLLLLTSLRLSPLYVSPGGSESSWDKEKLQSPPSSGAAHGLGHAGLSGQHGLSSSHLSSLQQNHLLANRESDACTHSSCLLPLSPHVSLSLSPTLYGRLSVLWFKRYKRI